MQTSNAKQNLKSNDEEWILLDEFSLRDFLSGQDRREGSTAGLLSPTAQKLGMLPESIENIAKTLAGFAKEERLEFPVRLRMFCQKKMIVGANATPANSRAYHADQAMEHSTTILDFGTKMNGGWGCFLIIRGRNVSEDAFLSSHHIVDLYLYREG